MGKKTRITTVCALFAALSVLFLYISSIWPTGRLGLVATASLFTAAAVCHGGVAPGIYVFIISSALGLLVIPNKSAAILYSLFFGYYPIIKSLAERVKNIALVWTIKLLVFNASLSVTWFFFTALIFSFAGGTPATALIFLGGNVVFVIYDYGFTKLIWLYINRVLRKAGG